MWSPLNHLITHIILVRVACGTNIHTYVFIPCRVTFCQGRVADRAAPAYVCMYPIIMHEYIHSLM